MRKACVLLMVPLAAQLLGCSYSYPIWATMVGGRLAFESGDRAYDCFTNIRVSANGPMARDPAIEAIADPLQKGQAIERARAAWMTDHVQTYECKARFPVLYGAPQPAAATIVAAKPLRIGVAYEVSTFGPKGAGGHGCFRIKRDGRPENIDEQACLYAGEATPPVGAPAVASGADAIGGQPINAMPPPDRTGPSQMYALTPYRGIERYLRDYPSLAACERARAAMRKDIADRRLCGFGPRSPAF